MAACVLQCSADVWTAIGGVPKVHRNVQPYGIVRHAWVNTSLRKLSMLLFVDDVGHHLRCNANDD